MITKNFDSVKEEWRKAILATSATLQLAKSRGAIGIIIVPDTLTTSEEVEAIGVEPYALKFGNPGIYYEPDAGESLWHKVIEGDTGVLVAI